MRLSDLPLTGAEKFLFAWAIVVTLLLFAAALAALADLNSPRLRLFIGALVLIAAVVFTTWAFAHDHNRPERNDWLKSLHANNKTWCCDGNDTDAIEDWEAKPSGYRVRFRGEWFDVPAGAIVDGPNTGGEALLWMNKGYFGLSVRCFMPGTMS